MQIILGQYYSAQLRFFRQLCTAAKMDTVSNLAKKMLDEGKCVVVGLQSTGEFLGPSCPQPANGLSLMVLSLTVLSFIVLPTVVTCIRKCVCNLKAVACFLQRVVHTQCPHLHDCVLLGSSALVCITGVASLLLEALPLFPLPHPFLPLSPSLTQLRTQSHLPTYSVNSLLLC